jgi:CheY-like chemotaxis protein
VASPTTNDSNWSEGASDQRSADVSPRSPPGGVPRVLNLAEASLKVPGSYRRPSRAQTLNYLDLDKMGQGADVDRLCDEIAERRARARRSERRMSPLGGARTELRTGDTLTIEGRAFLTRVQTSDGVATVPAAASGGVTEGTPGPSPEPASKTVARSLTAPLVRGQAPLAADTMLSNFRAFCRRLSGTGDLGKLGAVTAPQWVKLTKPSQDPFVRASVLLAIKGTANQEIAARFFQERGMLVTRARDWSSALALLKKDHRNSSASYSDRASESKRSSGRSSGEDRKENYDGDITEGFVKVNNQELSDTSLRARSRLLLENIAEGATAKEDLVLKQLKSRSATTKGWDVRDLSRRMSSFSLRRASKDFKQVSTSDTESAPPEVSKSKEAGRCFSLVLLDAALMPCALSDAESVDRCLKEVHRILGRVREESDRGNNPPVRNGVGAQNEESANLKQTNAGKTESFSLQAGSSFETKSGTRPAEMPHLVWLLGNETPAIVRRLLRSARLHSIMQKPVFISRLRALLDGLASATSQSSSAPSEPPTEERAVSSPNPARATPENPIPDLRVAIPEKPSFEEIVVSPTSERAPSNGTPTSAASPRSPVYLTPAAQEAMELFRVANYKVLVAEDTPILRQLAKAMLTKMNASVTAVENGQEAVAAVEAANFGEGNEDKDRGGERRPFDFVLMDCQVGYSHTTGRLSDPSLCFNHFLKYSDGGRMNFSFQRFRDSIKKGSVNQNVRIQCAIHGKSPRLFAFPFDSRGVESRVLQTVFGSRVLENRQERFKESLFK